MPVVPILRTATNWFLDRIESIFRTASDSFLLSDSVQRAGRQNKVEERQAPALPEESLEKILHGDGIRYSWCQKQILAAQHNDLWLMNNPFYQTAWFRCQHHNFESISNVRPECNLTQHPYLPCKRIIRRFERVHR